MQSLYFSVVAKRSNVLNYARECCDLYCGRFKYEIEFFLDGPDQERREKEGAVSHQRSGDKRVHHQYPQAHPWSVSVAGT